MALVKRKHRAQGRAVLRERGPLVFPMHRKPTRDEAAVYNLLHSILRGAGQASRG